MADDINDEIKDQVVEARRKAKQRDHDIKAAKEKLLKEQNSQNESEQQVEKESLPIAPEKEQKQQSEKEILQESEVVRVGEPEKATQPETITEQVKGSLLPKKTVKKHTNEGNLLDNIKNYESKVGDKYLHIRVNSKTLNLLNQLSHVTKISNTKIVGYALAEFFTKNPDLEEIIKKYFKNVEL